MVGPRVWVGWGMENGESLNQENEEEWQKFIGAQTLLLACQSKWGNFLSHHSFCVSLGLI